ncbi:MAG: ATP-binding protein [Planctomycetia bacterium]|nr:ATP-binding protein [Planctomycetia bacterium]
MEPLQVIGAFERLAELRDYVERAAATAGLDRKASYRLCLAVDELATNAMTHGRPSPEHEIQLRLHAILEPATLRIVLEDTGKPYDPRQTPVPTNLNLPLEEREPGGLGVFFALQSADEFQYERAGDWNRNVLVVRRVAGDSGTQAG